MWLYDVFISHASEDKDDFVRPLANALRELHVEVWYDEFTLQVGDSLRRSIDRGLARSRFAVVVLSPAFFRKNWPQRELDGLVAREMGTGDRVILPVWHNVTHADILEVSPPLADLLALSTERGVEEVAEEISKKARPRRSPLVAARDILLEQGIKPPVVTDEWWLDVVEASNMEYPWGYVSHREHWDRWSFWLPGDDGDPDERGLRLARTAMQLAWTAEADSRPITQITPPAEVLDFIESSTGLAEVCHEQPRMLATYAPQLTIPGFGGPFEDDFDELLAKSVARYAIDRERDPRFGSALTTDGVGPLCDGEIAFRHPSLGNYDPGMLTGQFVMGDMPGPPVQFYPTFEYVAWVLSDASSWLPQGIREQFRTGFTHWTTWQWHDNLSRHEAAVECAEYPERGELFDRMFDTKDEGASFELTDAARVDVERRCEDACRLLRLPESGSEIAERFLTGGFIEGFLHEQAPRRRRRGRE